MTLRSPLMRVWAAGCHGPDTPEKRRAPDYESSGPVIVDVVYRLSRLACAPAAGGCASCVIGASHIFAYRPYFLIRPDSMEAQMLDAFFWYTGFAFWILVAAGAACFMASEASDRSVRRRA